MLSLSCCYLLASLQHRSSLSVPMATWSRNSRSKKRYQHFGLDVCNPVQTLFQALPPNQSHHGRLRPEYYIYGHSGASSAPWATENGHSRSENGTSLALMYAIPFKPLFQAVTPIQSHHSCLRPE